MRHAPRTACAVDNEVVETPAGDGVAGAAARVLRDRRHHRQGAGAHRHPQTRHPQRRKYHYLVIVIELSLYITLVIYSFLMQFGWTYNLRRDEKRVQEVVF